MKWLIIPFMALLLLSCNNTKTEYQHFLNEQITKHYSDDCIKEYEYIVVIPRQGCNSCIKSAESFYKANKNDKRYLFIFTRIDSKKKLGLEIGVEELSRKNVILDQDNIFYDTDFYDSNYPLLIHREKEGTYTYMKLVDN